MAKLTRKLWVGIGAATLAGASAVGNLSAQDTSHKHQASPPPPPAQGGPATKTPGEGGEAYLTDGGPRDTRIRFYRDLELMRGHLLVGGQLIELGLWDEALPHFLHPTEELYGLMEKYIKLHRIQPFNRDLQALAQAVKAKRKGATEQALKVVDRRLDGALNVAKRFMTPVRTFTVRSAVEVLKVAQSEYAASMEDGRFVKPVEYQDSRGFMWQAERMFEASAAELAGIDKAALDRIRATFAKLKTAWPAPMPPDKPVLDVGEISGLISDIELHILRY
ncbi:MAG: hypothetical protein K2X43_04365 [Hyphomonadaceae bacterium]|jgi:hypothetical protein|nr:hypothetical protein [Hyphomonadaceae bacterium]